MCPCIWLVYEKSNNFVSVNFGIGQESAIYVSRHIGEELKKSASFKRGDYKEALIEVFLLLDEMMETAEGKKELSDISASISSKGTSFFGKPENEDIAFYVGCTACVALLAKGEIYVANAGDSRCVISKGGVAHDLSVDHKPELEEEKRRIERARGFVEDNRVNGILNLSRSLGDLEYKRNKALRQEDQMITAMPEVTNRPITPDIDFMILACDGIWDCLKSQQAVDFVLERISKATFKNPDKIPKLSKIIENMLDKIIATDVATSGIHFINIKSILAGIGCDNMTCLVVSFKK